MREVVGAMRQIADWIFWLFDQAWLWAFSFITFISDLWRDGPLW